MSAFQAIRVAAHGPPSVLALASHSLPEPKATEVLVRMHAAGVNPVDTYVRSGNYARKPQLPYTPGREGAGVIEALGAAVARFHVGDRVYLTDGGSGTYAEKCLVDAKHVRPLPSRLSFAQGAAVPVAYNTAYRALFQSAKARPGMKVLIHGGSGGVGLAAIQLGAMHGLQVLATAGTTEGAELAKQHGAITVFNHREAGYQDKIMQATDGKGVDVIVEMLANVNLGHDLKMLAHRGTVAVVGSRGDVQITPRDLMSREASIVGVMLGTVQEVEEAYCAIDAGLACGALNPVVGTTYPLAEAPAAHTEVIEHKNGSSGKIILTME